MSDLPDDSSDLIDEDETNAASVFQMRENMAALEAHRAILRPETHPDFDGSHCVDCGQAIPKLRLQMERVRCVDCQNIVEIKAKQNPS